LGTGFFVHHRTGTTVKPVEFVNDRGSYLVLRGPWCNIIVLNVHAPSEERSDDSKDNFCEELQQVFYHFLLDDFNTKLGREDTFKPQLGMRVYTRILISKTNSHNICVCLTIESHTIILDI